MPSGVLTIGHSNLTIDIFLSRLRDFGVSAVADVRSSPFSRHFPHFNQTNLSASLHRAGIAYAPLGRELGGRPPSLELYRDGVADYEKMAVTPAFLSGIERVIKGSSTHSIAMMCSEHDPLDCHRCLLVGRALVSRGLDLNHIMRTGSLATQSETEDRLINLFLKKRRNSTYVNMDRNALLPIAYAARTQSVAYKSPIRADEAPVDIPFEARL